MGLRRSFKPINIVQGGNFPSTSGWSATASTNTVSNNILSNAGDGTNASARVNGTTSIACVIGKKIYIKAKLTIKNSVASGLILYVGTTGIGGKEVVRQLIPTQNIQYTLSGIVTLDANDVGNIQPRCYHYYVDAATANGKVMEVQQVFAVDISTLPVEIQSMSDANIKSLLDTFPWFDGALSASGFGGIGGLK